MIVKVISGGQNGADQGGLRAAYSMGIPTGGVMPKGYRTLDGTSPGIAKKYGLKESYSFGYPARTEANVKNSDGTIRFASNFSSAGERCTVKYVRQYFKSCIDVNVVKPIKHEDVVDWIIENKIEVLNVAGNSEQTSPGIGNFVEEYLKVVIEMLREKVK